MPFASYSDAQKYCLKIKAFFFQLLSLCFSEIGNLSFWFYNATLNFKPPPPPPPPRHLFFFPFPLFFSPKVSLLSLFRQLFLCTFHYVSFCRISFYLSDSLSAYLFRYRSILHSTLNLSNFLSTHFSIYILKYVYYIYIPIYPSTYNIIMHKYDVHIYTYIYVYPFILYY